MKSFLIETSLARFADSWVNQRSARASQRLIRQKAECRFQNFTDSQDGRSRLSRGEVLERIWDVEKTDGIMPPGIEMRHFVHRETLGRTASGTLHGTDQMEFHDQRSLANRSYVARAQGASSTTLALGKWNAHLDGLPGLYGKWPAKGRIESRVKASLESFDPTIVDAILAAEKTDSTGDAHEGSA